MENRQHIGKIVVRLPETNQAEAATLRGREKEVC
jgi:hypothetical protein